MSTQGKSREQTGTQVVTTRRAMIANNVRAILTLGAAVAAASIANVAPARANGRGHGHGGGHGGMPCFLRGTKIRTVDGERCVEDIAIGDGLPTAFGRTRAVQWVGSWTCTKRGASEAWSRHLRPVRIVRSALASGVPHADLYVSQGHALFIDGVLVPAGSLVNGTTIMLHDADEFDELEYFHIKLATHDVIYAEGAPSETLLKVQNTAQYAHDGRGQETHCAPILCNGARSRMISMTRSAVAPWLGPQKLDLIRARLQQQAVAIC